MTDREEAQRFLNEWARRRLRDVVQADAIKRARIYAEHDIAMTRALYAYQSALHAVQTYDEN